MIKGIEHVAIVARDTAKLRDWYQQMFEFRQVHDNGKGAYFLMAPDGAMIELIGAQTPAEATGPVADVKTAGIRHLALTVADEDFAAMVTRLKNAGVTVVSDVSVSPDGIKIFYFRDPEENILHLIFRPKPLG